MRQILSSIFVTPVKCKFQHFHPRKSAFPQKRSHRVCQKSQILSDNRLASRLFLQRRKQSDPRSFSPSSLSCVRSSVGYRIIRIKAPEMVDAQYVIDSAQIPDSVNPPCKTVFRHIAPVKQRISPQLSRRRKPVRRTAGNFLRYPVFIKLKQFRMRPYSLCRTSTTRKTNALKHRCFSTAFPPFFLFFFLFFFLSF